MKLDELSEIIPMGKFAVIGLRKENIKWVNKDTYFFAEPDFYGYNKAKKIANKLMKTEEKVVYMVVDYEGRVFFRTGNLNKLNQTGGKND